jgi:hypothetical protein
MKPLIQCKLTILPLFIAGVLACFGLLPKALAVVPAPDGGYPGFNTAEGTNALQNLTTGVGNTAAGWHSLFANSAGNLNTAIGAGALLLNTGVNNTATGALALLSNTTGIANTASGAFALQNNTTGTFNIGLGDGAGSEVSTADRVICIGAAGANVSNSCYIGSIAGQTVGAGGATCYVDNDGKLGVFLSARRFKENIHAMEEVSEALYALKPVTFHYKPELDKTGIPQFGLVAEEVAKVNPDLVTHDAKGELYTVRYEAVNVMLLNEFLKEHRKNEEQQATIARLIATDTRQQKQIAALTAALQKVSAQLAAVSPSRGGLELSEPAPQLVDNE